MIAETTVISHLRFFREGSAYYDDYDAILTVQWLGTDTVYISGFKGKVQRSHYRELMQWFRNKNVNYVTYHRSEKHKGFIGDKDDSTLIIMSVDEWSPRFLKETQNA